MTAGGTRERPRLPVREPLSVLVHRHGSWSYHGSRSTAVIRTLALSQGLSDAEDEWGS